uniref:B30.2/SPRY domain-containing protein n=1 Tax=Globodera pallida TaxID=36090 RepID=A0A183C7T3_GLOPA
MPTFLFLAAICLLVGASILLETDASPKPNKKLEKGPSSAANAESTPGLTTKNRWATPVEPEATPDKKLALIETDGLIVQFTGEKREWRSVFAKQSIPKNGIFYYEVTILEKGINVYIGLATKNMELNNPVGWSEGTYAYSNYGDFWGHEFEGCPRYKGRPVIRGKPTFEKDDIIGCGVDLKTGQIIYTKNGERLATRQMIYKGNGQQPLVHYLQVDSAAELYPCISFKELEAFVDDIIGCGVDLKTGQIIYTKNGERLATRQMIYKGNGQQPLVHYLQVDSAAELYPCISLYKPGTKIEANFGPKFKYTA